MYKFGLACSLLFIVTLTACFKDSGSTKSGGGTAAPPATTTAPPASGTDDASGSTSPSTSEFVGTYSGTVTYTISGPGISTSDSESFVVVIETDGSVVVDGSYAGQLSGNSFAISASGTETINGITCSGTVSVSGSISGNTISGTFPPTILDCGGIPLTFMAAFTATKG